MLKIAVVLYGLPGSGKSTQARLLSEKLGLIQFDTGEFLESIVYDPARQKEKRIRQARHFFETGKLITPSFVLKEVEREVRKIAKIGRGVVFSGSPRTLFEAERLVPFLEKLYPLPKDIKKKSRSPKLFFFLLKTSIGGSRKRNANRWVCSFCKEPLLTAYYPVKKPKYCPNCGARLYRRSLDSPKKYSVRLAEYRKRTEPIFAFLKERKYQIKEINGEQAPYKVFQDISRILKKKTGNGYLIKNKKRN